MKLSTFLKNATLTLASVGLVVPQAGISLAAEQTPAVRQEKTTLADVSLNAKGQLVGQVVDHSGIARANSAVTVATLQGEVVSKTTTDSKGNFTADVKKGGTYVVAGTVASSAVRVWTQPAAPPSANTGIMIVDDAQAVRGQLFFDENGNPRWIMIGVGIAVTGGVIAAAINQGSGS